MDQAAVQKALEAAVRLEHATVPVYLTALYSLVPGRNDEIAAVLREVVAEEMLHMLLACNLLNAVGGRIDMRSPSFMAQYPGPLPGSVESGLIVELKRFSLESVQQIFMSIEAPAQLPNSLEPPATGSPSLPADSVVTIGEFYTKIGEALKPGFFTGDPAFQLDLSQAGWRFPNLIVPVTNVDSALKAIDTIVEQGEGNSWTPVDLQGQLSHYFKFWEIAKGNRLVHSTSNPVDFEFSGQPIPFDQGGVYPIKDNAHSSDYPKGSKARIISDQFNHNYTLLLGSLNWAVNGKPDFFSKAMGLMFSLKLLALELVQIELAPGINAAPTFEHLPTLPEI